MIPSRAGGWLALVAFMLPLPVLRPTPRTDTATWQQLLAAFEGRGIRVLDQHPRCREPDLDGLYVRGLRELVVCPRGDRSLTLRHEGWHLVQSLCLGDGPWLSAERIERRLTRQDRRELQALVQPQRRRREAEARAMAQLPAREYLAELDRACTERLPVRAATPDS